MKVFKINYSFYFLFILILFSPKQYLFLKILLCLFIHELFHILFVFIFKYKVRKIELSVFGFFMELDKNKNLFYKDLLIYLGGIIGNLLIIILISDYDIKIISLILIIINLLPIYPLDGYNILSTFLMRIIPYFYSLLISKIISLLTLFIITFYLVYLKIDLYVFINLIYLLCINLITICCFDSIINSFLLDRYLYKFEYKKKEVKLKSNLKTIFYKYFNIYVSFGEKNMSEFEILRILFEKT